MDKSAEEPLTFPEPHFIPLHRGEINFKTPMEDLLESINGRAEKFITYFRVRQVSFLLPDLPDP